MERYLFLWKYVLIILLIALMATVGVRYYQEKTKIIPEEVIAETIKKVLDAESYRYTVTSQITDQELENKISEVEGERNSKGDYHIVGTIVDTPVDVYQISNTMYYKDPTSEKWIKVKGSELTRSEIFMAELNPLVNFDFGKIDQAEYLGVENYEEEKFLLLTVQPEIENKFLDVLWDNFNYRLWVTRKDRVLRRAVVTAENKNDSEIELKIDVHFRDFNKKVEFTPPDV